MASLAQVAGGAVATVLAGAYANSALGVSKDIGSLRSQRVFERNLAAHLKRVGLDSAPLYRMMCLADPKADAVFFEGRSWTYEAMKREVDMLALGLRDMGVKNGDVVSIFMTNSPEFLFTAYALSKLGAIPGLLNSNLRDDPLLHCVKVGESKLILTTPDLAAFAARAASRVSGHIKTVRLNLGSFSRTLPVQGDISDFPFAAPDAKDDITTPPKKPSDVALFMFTSGTTGYPKACSVKNMLIMLVSCPGPHDFPLFEKGLDPKYAPLRSMSCMPLFHGTTFFGGACSSLGMAGCFCVSRKFSARNFWKEAYHARATKILYVGELCRFLLAAPKSEYDRKHLVRVAYGNGLQKDVWIPFQKRFGIQEIREFYRSTEGLVKFDHRWVPRHGSSGTGKVGFQGVMVRRQEKSQYLVKFDYETEAPWRDPRTGFCVPAKKGEPGEGIARIFDLSTYTNYHNNQDATDKKILRDVFEKGDIWQRSGDLLMQESSGWVRFVDRIGDTFRWRGENVSAGEIRAYVAELPEVQDAVVVGKVLTGYDGQAGVAALRLSTTTEQEERAFMHGLCEKLKGKGVPDYALPRLVAVTDEIKVGDTFKHAKQVVKALRWGGAKKRYFLDLTTKQYRPLEAATWSTIEAGTAKL